MSTITVELDPLVVTIGELIGMIKDEDFNEGWFSDPGNELADSPKRLQPLLTLIDDLLGPAEKDGPPVFAGAQWFALRNPLNGTPTGFYLVTPDPASNPTSGDIGIGVLHPMGYQNLTIQAYAYVPLFTLSTSAEPVFIISKKPSHIGLRAEQPKADPFKAPNNVTFTALTLDVDLFFADEVPSMSLTFENLQNAGSTPGTYTSLSELIDHIDTVVEWIASVILQGTYWLNTYVGRSSFTIGDILKDACILTVVDKKDGEKDDQVYELNLAYLKANYDKPKTLALNFLFNVLNDLADSETPLIPIPVGAEGSGIYIVKEADAGGGSDYGLRLMIQDIAFGGSNGKQALATTGANGQSKPKPEFLVQLGKWIAGESDANSWVARSLDIKQDPPKPGISFYLLNTSATDLNCSSTPPTVTFDPHIEFISLGFDVRGGQNQPLFNVNGFILSGAELRLYLKKQSHDVTFGAGVSLDGLGMPLGPGFGEAGKGSGTNKVAQSLLESGADAGGGAEPSGDKDPVNPSFSVSAADVGGGSFVMQLYDKEGKPAKEVTIPIQRAIGPLQCQTLGIGWVQDVEHPKNDKLSLLFDGGVKLGTLDIDLMGLSIGIPVTTPGDFSRYDLDLDGIGITFTAGQVEVSAAFVRAPKGDPPPPDYTAYNGEALVKIGTFAIEAIGSYAYVDDGDGKGYASMFIFGVFDGDLGDPTGTGGLFITGLAAGFGYNRGLKLPDMSGVPEFLFVAAASDPTKLGGLPPDPAKALADLGDTVPPERGEYWLAAGVRFTSFDLINSTALVTVAFGHELEIALLGLSWISLPPPPAPGAAAPDIKYAYAELGIEVKLLPSEGVFSATAILTPNSFVIDPACKLTGGFAFFFWFGDNPHAGEFVLTLGGYHPDFKRPSYYPRVPRLGFNWPLPSNVTISGDAYFALTPSAIMAGGGLQVLFHKGNLKAWFKAQMDAYIQWSPFHYNLNISISLGVSYRVHLLFVTVTLKVELGADLQIWGPKTGGKVHINWHIISFTIPFGADESDALQPLHWSNDDGTGFAQTLLPHITTKSAAPAPMMGAGLAAAAAAPPPDKVVVVPSGVYTVAVNDGLLKNYKKGTEMIWIVRPNHFVFSTITTFPATEIDMLLPAGSKAQGKSTTAYTATVASETLSAAPCSSASTSTPVKVYKIAPNAANPVYGGAGYYVCVRPMKATLKSSIFSIQLCLEDDTELWDLAEKFDFDVVFQAVPAAKWDKPLDGDPEPNKLLPQRLLGLENIRPKAPTLTPNSGAPDYTPLLDIDIKTAFTYDVVDDVPDETPAYTPYHLPLNAGQTPTGAVPHTDANVLDTIHTTLMDAGVVAQRTALFTALQGLGINPSTNGTLTTLADNPGVYLNGNPLVNTPA